MVSWRTLGCSVRCADNLCRTIDIYHAGRAFGRRRRLCRTSRRKVIFYRSVWRALGSLDQWSHVGRSICVRRRWRFRRISFSLLSKKENWQVYLQVSSMIITRLLITALRDPIVWNLIVQTGPHQAEKRKIWSCMVYRQQWPLFQYHKVGLQS
jgi:hypothetical protein